MGHSTTNEGAPLDLNEFMESYLSDFQPFAYFDKHLDCIRVQIRDCSVTETRLSKIFTILYANHADRDFVVGFTIKGVRHLFEELNLKTDGVMKITDLIDSIVRSYPHAAVTAVEEFAASSAKDMKDMEVDLSDLAA